MSEKRKNKQEREFVSVGGDLEASFDGHRSVDVRVKGSSKTIFMSRDTLRRVLSLFPLGDEREEEIESGLAGYPEFVESVAREEASIRQEQVRSTRPDYYCLGFPRGLMSEESLKSAFRDAVSRLRDIFTYRFFGNGSISEEDQKLLRGELDILVPPGHTISLTTIPQVPFRPSRLVIDDASADHFLVADVKVGKNSQLVNACGLPGSSFKAASPELPLRMDAAQIGMAVTVVLTNVSDKSRPVPQVALYGTSAT